MRLPVFPLRLLVLGADRPQGSDYKAMAIHADVGGWNAGMAALFSSKMTIEATDLKFLRVYSVRISDGLPRLITLLVSRKAQRY